MCVCIRVCMYVQGGVKRQAVTCSVLLCAVGGEARPKGDGNGWFQEVGLVDLPCRLKLVKIEGVLQTFSISHCDCL